MNNDIKNTELGILLNVNNLNEILFQKNYPLKLHDNFIKNKESKKHNMLNHTTWFKWKIKINHQKEIHTIINRWKICMVDYWMNIWTEINWIRPSLVFKSNTYIQWEDIVVIPLTSFKDWSNKSMDTFDIIIEPDGDNNLKQKSLIKIRQIKCISKKRIKRRKWSDKLNIFWEIKDLTLRKEVENKERIMLWL